MTDTRERIAAGLERAFAQGGFARPSIDELREAAGVSLRTLYRHFPSREDMVMGALERRHRRYLALLLDGLPEDGARALHAVIDRLCGWMRTEAPHGCLFHAAVAAAPGDERIRALLGRHKDEIARRVARAAGLDGCEHEVSLILEGLQQAWPHEGEAAERAARRLADLLLAAARGG